MRPILTALRSGRWRKAGPGVSSVRRPLLFAGVLCGALATGAAAWAGEGGVALSAPWFRLVMPSLPAAGYFTLSNASGKTRTLSRRCVPEASRAKPAAADGEKRRSAAEALRN